LFLPEGLERHGGAWRPDVVCRFHFVQGWRVALVEQMG